MDRDASTVLEERAAPRLAEAGPGRRIRKRRPTKKITETVVVIGNGPVGYKFCEALMAESGSERFRVVVFGEERRPAYNRVQLTQLFDRRSADELAMAPEGWYAEQGIELRTGDRVVAVNREARRVRGQSGREVVYDRLVFATGSRAFVPPLEGASLPGVFVYRTAEDIAGIQAYAPFCRRAVILGGGLLGLEAAHAVKRLGPETWVLERGSSLLARHLDREGGALLEKQVRAMGLKVRTECEVERIDAVGPDRLLQLKSGEQLRAQLVILAVGIRPRTELAEDCGLEVHPKGGIVVDDFLQTGDPRIFAIGECASHRGVFYGLAAPGYRMAKLLAVSFARGRRRKFVKSDPSTWLKLPGTAVAMLGDFQGGETHLTASREGGYRRIGLVRNRIVGAAAVGEWPEQARMQELVERRARIWRWQQARFIRTGRIWRGVAPQPVAQWPAEAMICNCKGVRLRTLRMACEAGCATAEQLAERTGASTVCGSCRPLLDQFTGAIATRVGLPGTRMLLIAALVALILSGIIALAPQIPLADSVEPLARQRFSFDAFFQSTFIRQISGFTLAGLSLLGMGLSLRKRLTRFQWGAVSVWKAVHAVMGVLALVALVSHTGFRLGQNLNFVLMLNFVALAAVGSLAAGVTALEARLPARAARQVRTVWTGAHIALAWPLPVLVIFHVLASYRF